MPLSQLLEPGAPSGLAAAPDACERFGARATGEAVCEGRATAGEVSAELTGVEVANGALASGAAPADAELPPP